MMTTPYRLAEQPIVEDAAILEPEAPRLSLPGTTPGGTEPRRWRSTTVSDKGADDQETQGRAFRFNRNRKIA